LLTKEINIISPSSCEIRTNFMILFIFLIKIWRNYTVATRNYARFGTVKAVIIIIRMEEVKRE
jgi:hypothetical protein